MDFTVPSCKRRLALAAVLLSALVLAGCAVAPNTGSGSRSGHSGSSSTQTRDPLLDAPHHSETTCTTDRPVTVLSRMSETPLVCDDLGVTTTLSEMRDAGWRVVTLSIGADSDAAWECVRSFDVPACVIIKHANPCGVAVAATHEEAYAKAFLTDSKSAFGGIIAFNGPVTRSCAERISHQFAEVIIAPEFDEGALELFGQKKNLRLLKIALGSAHNDFEFKRVGGGLLVQTPDIQLATEADLRVVTKKVPTPKQISDMLFAWNVARFVKSNTIVYAKDGMTLGVGAGQMSRVDSARIAAIKAEEGGLSLAESVAASDAFFPFRDGLDVVADQGAVAVIQPGGSIRDPEVIAAADERGIAMVFTGERHFRH